MHQYLGKHLNIILDAPQDIHQELSNLNLASKGIYLEYMKPCDNNIRPIWQQTQIQDKLHSPI